MSENNFVSSVESLFRGMNSFVSASTVVGEAIHIGDTIILPLADVTFGVGAGALTEGNNHKNNAGGGMGGKISPSAVLVIQNGHTKLVNVKNQDSMTKILDMVPDMVNHFTKDKELDLDDVVKNVKKHDKKKDEAEEVIVDAEDVTEE